MRNKKAKALRKANPVKKEPNYTQKGIKASIYQSKDYGYAAINAIWFGGTPAKHKIPNSPYTRSGMTL